MAHSSFQTGRKRFLDIPYSSFSLRLVPTTRVRTPVRMSLHICFFSHWRNCGSKTLFIGVRAIATGSSEALPTSGGGCNAK